MGCRSRTKRRTLSEPLFTASARELLLEQLVQLRGVRLAAGGLHDLADEDAEQLVLARTVVGELAGILRHHLVDGLLDGAGVGDLLEALRLDDRIRLLALSPHRLEHVL